MWIGKNDPTSTIVETYYPPEVDVHVPVARNLNQVIVTPPRTYTSRPGRVSEFVEPPAEAPDTTYIPFVGGGQEAGGSGPGGAENATGGETFITPPRFVGGSEGSIDPLTGEGTESERPKISIGSGQGIPSVAILAGIALFALSKGRIL